MSDLKVRKIDFTFDSDIPFQSCPDNPQWGNVVNYITIIAPSFERYFIKAVRLALPSIKDPKTRRDAELFCQQEAQHSKQHFAHLKVLTRKFPALEETRIAVLDSYDRLLDEHPLEFHLSYAATVELWFGPTSKYFIESRDELFGRTADPRVASFLMWHFVEEFEHRNAAIDVYNDVVGNWAYRMKTMPLVVKHLVDVSMIARDGIRRHVPHGDGPIGPVDTDIRMFRSVPLLRSAAYLAELACTLLPYHRPDSVKQPEWATQWFADEAAGRDMTRYFP